MDAGATLAKSQQSQADGMDNQGHRLYRWHRRRHRCYRELRAERAALQRREPTQGSDRARAGALGRFHVHRDRRQSNPHGHGDDADHREKHWQGSSYKRIHRRAGIQPVPEKKIGNPYYDDPPTVTDQTCRNKVNPKMKEFPLGPGEQSVINVQQARATFTLIKTKDASVSFGAPAVEPEPPPGEKPSKPDPIFPDTAMQWYAPVCVYYFDKAGTQYGSCRML